MSPRAVVVMIAVVAVAGANRAAAAPVRRTLNFNMFVLRPRPDAPDRLILSTDGVSRMAPVLEYLAHRVQGLLSVKNPQKHEPSYEASTKAVPFVDASENEIDGEQNKTPIIVRPSRTKPGTFEVEIDVVMDDGQPQALKLD